MSKHTPGPWSVILRGERGTFHIPQAQKHEAENADDGVDGHTVSSANARLIAAAPDLLEALELMVELCHHANPGAFSNGVTDSTGLIDEGDVIASRIIGQARAALSRAAQSQE